MADRQSEAAADATWPRLDTSNPLNPEPLGGSTHARSVPMVQHVISNAVSLGIQAALIGLGYFCSFLLRFDGDIPTIEYSLLIRTIPFVLAMKLLVFSRMGLLRVRSRSIGISDLMDITIAAGITSVLLGVLFLGIAHLPGFPRSTLLIDLLLTIVVFGGIRVAMRAYAESAQTKKNALLFDATEDASTIAPRVKSILGAIFLALRSTYSETWKRSKAEFRLIRSREALTRIAADVLFINASMLIAAVVWRAIYTGGRVGVVELITGGKYSILTYVALWSALGVVVFYLHGFYTRTRGYAGRYKLLAIIRAVSIVVCAVVLADYVFMDRGFSRAVAGLGWMLMMVSIGGARFAKDLLLASYRIEPRAKQPTKAGKRVLVCGGAGYVGTALIPQLLSSGYKVRVLDSFMFGSATIEPFRADPDFEVVTGDIRDIQSVVQAVRDCDAVIDLAAIVGDPACEENRQLAVEVNRAATRMMIDIARGYGVTRFLFASSCSVYGAADFLMDEQSAVTPISTYAQTKVDSEKLLLEAASQDFHPTILRLGTLFGLSGRPRLDLVVNLLTARAATTGKITVFNGTQWRPFLHVTDAARAFVICLNADPVLVSGEIFNVGDYNLNFRLTDISEQIKTAVPFTEIENVDNGDLRNYRVSFDKIHCRLGFRCQKTVPEGVAEIYDWVKSTNVTDLTSAQFNNLAMMRAFILTDQAQKSPLRILEGLAKTA